MLNEIAMREEKRCDRYLHSHAPRSFFFSVVDRCCPFGSLPLLSFSWWFDGSTLAAV